ncbi:hypothetical protein NDU88_000732 [Pleurodeles waltl]|uniref:Uncharacterized protein n=1 Tax=Pleurodeles waltl TaxID=8319 RepID=A0AAV7KWI5_PLEWA|nr:hypothetical protein NDU88_000732 [Pleurodeles waltl]
MGSKYEESTDTLEEEQAQTAVSIQDTDSEADSGEDSQLITAVQLVSTLALMPTTKRPIKSLGAPLPESVGSTQNKIVGDRPSGSASKKAKSPHQQAMPVSVPELSRRPHSSELKIQHPASEPKSQMVSSGLNKIRYHFRADKILLYRRNRTFEPFKTQFKENL